MLAGTFVNQALAHVGASIIDSTLALSDSLPAHAPVTVYVHNSDVSITKGDAPDPIAPGDTLTYTLFVRAAGPDTAFSVSVLDTLPLGATFVSAVTSRGTVNEASGIVSAALGDFPADMTATITITVTTGGPQTLVNRAHAVSPIVDYLPGNNDAAATTTVAIPPTPDLELVKRASAATFLVGEIATYTLTLTNLGTQSTLGTITVVDTLPAGVTFVAGGGAGWSVGESGGIVTATRAASLAVPDSAQVVVQVRVGASAVPGIVNAARSFAFGDGNAVNDTSSVATLVGGAPDLRMSKLHAGDFNVGQPAQYTLTAFNDGSLPTTSAITVVDTLPAGLSFVSGSGAGWAVNEAGGIVTGTYATALAAGDSASFTLDVAVSGAAVPFVINTAVASTPGDVGSGNDRYADSTRVFGVPDLQMVKRALGAPFTVGGTATYALTVINVGSDATTAPITLTDTLAPGLLFLTGAGPGWIVNEALGTITASFASALAAGDSAAVTINLQVSAAAFPSVENLAVAASPGDGSALNDSSRTATAVTSAPDVRLAKTHAGDFTVGQPGQYVVSLYNDGSEPTGGTITVLDTLPAGLTFVSGAGAGFGVSEAGGIVTGTFAAALAPGDSASFTIDVAVAPAALPGVTNAAVAEATGDVNDGNDRGLDPTVVLPAPVLAPDLQMVKRALTAPFTVGGLASYSLTVTNVGSGPTSNPITMTDALAAGLSYVGGAGAGWTVNESLGIVSAIHAGSLAAGDSAVVTLVLQIGAAAFPAVDNLAIAANLDDASAGNDSSRTTTPVSSAPDVRLAKAHADDFTVGQPGQYVLTLYSEGSEATTGTVTVLDTLPAGLAFVSGAGAGWIVNEAGGVVSAIHPGAIAPGDSASFTIDVAVAAPAVPGVTNAALASAAGDVNGGNDRALDPTLVLPLAAAPDLQMVKRALGAPFTVGGGASYSLTVTNVGTSPTTGAITITDALATGLSFVSGAGTGWTVNETFGVVTAVHAGAIAAGDSATVSLALLVGPLAAPSIGNLAFGSTVGDASAGNDSSSTSTPVNGAPDLRLAKSHAGNFTEGQVGQYALTVFNDGSLPTSGTITVRDTLPAGLSFVTGAGTGWTIVEAGGVVTATSAGPIAAAASALFTMDVLVSAAAVPGVTNTAVASTPGDVGPGNDRALDPTTVDAAAAAPDLALAKSHVGAFTVGSMGRYALVVTNAGSAPTTGTITVVDSLPTGLTLIAGAGAGWSFVPSGNIVTATHAGPLAPADTLGFTLDVAVGAAALPAVINVAVAATPGDGSAANDRATDPTALLGSPDLALFKRHLGTLTVGTNGQYQIAVQNLGTAATAGTITVRDTLPASLGFVAAAGTGWSTGFAAGVVTATNAGPIAAGDSATFVLTVSVGAAAYPAVLNAAEVQAAGDLNPGNDRGSDLAAPAPALTALAVLALEKRASPTRVEPADIVNYTLVVRNLSVSPLPFVVVQDTLPVGFRFASGTASIDGTPVVDPAGVPGAALTFAIGTVPASGALTLRYRALVGTAAVLGDGTNRALAENAGLGIRSNLARARVQVEGGVFSDEGVIAGKVWADCDCDSNRTQGAEELGVPGVRIYLEDGRSSVTDVEGKYHFEAVAPRLHTVKLDRATLPRGARLVALGTRDALDPGSKFADMKNGELLRADFAVAGCDAASTAEIKARRELGEVRAAIVTGQPTLAANVEPGATRVLDGAPWAGQPAPESDDGAYFHLEPKRSLDAANSRVPDAPGTPGLLLGHAPKSPDALEISVPRRPAPADGRTLVPVTVRVPGTEPVLVTLDTDLGLWQVADQDQGTDGIQTHVTRQATFLLVSPPAPGAATVRVTQVTDRRGPVTLGSLTGVREAEAALVFVPAAQPWLISGTIEGRYDGRSTQDLELAPGQLRDRFEDAFGTVSWSNDDGTSRLGARGAMFARGSIGKGALATFRFDSEHAHGRRRFDDIRPDEGDPVFGDASIQGFEAQSTERLYGRIDKGRSYALFGDFMTGGLDPIRVLGAYTRGINGGRAHLEQEKAALDAFATHDRDRQVIDEQPGRGISGPYPLSRRDGVLNSERVEIVTRDRNQPSVILERRMLVRFADYTIEPFTGRLLFRAPVASLDERLNPVSIRVSYEVEGGGDRFWTVGGSAHVRPVRRIELMGSYVREDDPLEEHEQFGAGATVELFPRTFATGEWAHTDSAGMLTANAFRGEIRHASRKLDLRGFGVRTDAGFDNPSSGYAAGRREFGGAGRYALDRRTSLAAEAVRTQDLVTGGRRTGASLAIDRRLSGTVTFGLGYRHGRESVLPAGGGPAVPTPNETDAARARLAAQFDKRASAYLEYEKNLGHGSSKRLELGADLRVTDHVRAYGRHEFLNSAAGPYAMNDIQAYNTTVLGFAADGKDDLSAFSEYRIRDAFAGRNAEAAIGLRDRLRISRSVRLVLSAERVSPLSGPGVTALASGLEWTGDPSTKGSLRLEYRTALSEDQWLASAGLARKLGPDWTGLLRSTWSWSPGSRRTVARDEIAFAVRETDVNRWNALGRIEHRLDDQELDPGILSRQEVWLAST
ncbi:MAG: hypothetical protein ABIY55_11825, partial [Kofleriaceae bacterium]